jgi:glycosyltransferase
MKHLYYIINECTAGNYGVGTYTRQIISSLNDDEKITVVHLQSNQLEVSTKYDGSIRHIYIPKCAGDEYIEIPHLSNLYYRTVFYLLKPFISGEDDIIFHFQYTHVLPMVHWVKEYYPKCIAILTLHYMEWAFVLQGNTEQLKSIIRQQRNELKTENERIVYDSFYRTKELFLSVDKTICLCKYAFELLTDTFNIPKEKIVLIPNGLDLSSNDTEGKIYKKRLFTNERIILFVGRLERNKGVCYLLEAFRILLSRIKNLRLVIVGDGDFRPYLKQCIGIWDKVSFTGKLDAEIIHELYEQAHVGVLPSFNEQCSYVVIEMLQHGLPVVGTNSTGLSEMISEGINGYKVKIQKDNTIYPDELADKIMLCLDNPQLSETAFDYYQNYYTAERMVKEYRNLYRSL